MPVAEPHRATAIRLLAQVVSDGVPPTERELRVAEAIVDSVTAHTIEVHRALMRAEERLAGQKSG